MTEPYASHDASEIEHKTANESCHLELYVISHQILNTMPNVLHTNLLSEGRFFSCVFDTLMCTTLVGPTLGPRPPVMSLFFKVGDFFMRVWHSYMYNLGRPYTWSSPTCNVPVFYGCMCLHSFFIVVFALVFYGCMCLHLFFMVVCICTRAFRYDFAGFLQLVKLQSYHLKV